MDKLSLIRTMIVLVAIAVGTAWSADPVSIAVARFSTMSAGAPIPHWSPMTFPSIDVHTQYDLVDDGGRTVLRATSHKAASGLVKPMDVDPHDYPILTWQWKVEQVVAQGDITRKAGDDYAARIYVTFADDPQRLTWLQRTQLEAVRWLYGERPPSSALAYVWGNHAAIDSIHPNAYTDRLQMIPVESGRQHLNRWRTVRRNIVSDYQRAFGAPPPRITAIAVMTDTDNTGSSATAWYGDITLIQPSQVMDPETTNRPVDD